jgi:hypothetical protein
MIHIPQYLGDYADGATVYLFWNTFGSSDESITQSGLAVTDIEIYKNGSMTQRSSDSGYTLLDTDGTDLDSSTGCHGVSIDLSDDSDSGFFAIGNDYMIMINAVTVNSQTVRFCAGTFSIQNRATANGVGDYAVTLTIRTTGGSAVSGVSVWVNTSNDRSGSVAGTKVTDSNGQVTFYLEYTTHYIFCHLSGYTFAAASFTASAGSVSFTKDIATAVNTGSSSFYADSFLSRCITDVRESLDEPTASAKYSDSRIIELLEKAYILVLNEKNRNSKTPAVVKQSLTIASGTTEYVLPHVLGSVYGVYDLDNDTGCKIFYDGRSRYNSFGQKLWLEENTLHIQTVDSFGLGSTLTVEWIPSGVARLHNGTCTISDDGLTVTFGSTPNAGELDTHHQAYAGSVFRCLGVDGSTVTGNYLQERIITDYDETTREATLDVALSPIPTTDDGYIYYEIAPAISKGMDTVVALYTAYRIMTTEGNLKRAKGILDAYRNELRNVRLTAYYSNMPEAPRQRGDNFDNRRYGRI